MPDPLFPKLSRDTGRPAWHPMDQVRRRGRQATRRTRIAAGLASAVAVAAVATGAATASGRPGAAPPLPPARSNPTPTGTIGPTTSAEPSTPPSPPSPTVPSTIGTSHRTVPAAALLHLADLPDGFRAYRSDTGSDWPLESVASYCRNQTPSLLVGEVGRRVVRFDSLTDVLVERVTRHSDGTAASVMDNVREFVADCDPYRPDDSLTILADGLGGAESVLVGSVIEGEPGRWLLVRRGDLVAQLRLDGQATEAEARSYARKVAARLCAGTDAC